MTLKFVVVVVAVVVVVVMNANNDPFAVLFNIYFSVYEWRFIWCHFVVDVKENAGGGGGGGAVTFKYRRLYAFSCNRQHVVHRGLDLAELS